MLKNQPPQTTSGTPPKSRVVESDPQALEAPRNALDTSISPPLRFFLDELKARFDQFTELGAGNVSGRFMSGSVKMVAAGIVAPIVERYKGLAQITNELREITASDRSAGDASFKHEYCELLRRDISRLRQEIRDALVERRDEPRGVILELRARGGGPSSGEFVGELARMYSRFSQLVGLSVDVVDSHYFVSGEPRDITLRIEGPKAFNALRDEGGLHRVIRKPSQGSGSKASGSSVAVSVLPLSDTRETSLNPSEVEFSVCRSSGPGGQGVNTTDSAVVATHIPTKISVSIQSQRSQLQNKRVALEILERKVAERERAATERLEVDARRSQIGVGYRPPEVRTYHCGRNVVIDHRLEESVPALDEFLDGQMKTVLAPLSDMRADEELKAVIEKGVDSFIERQLTSKGYGAS